MDEPKVKSRGRFWMFLPVMLLGASVAGWIVMVRLAVDDPGFSLEPDYYKKAVEFDAREARRREADDVGFRVDVESFARDEKKTLLRIRVSDRSGALLDAARVRGVGFSNARAARVVPLTFRSAGAGIFVAEFDDEVHLGLWELRLEISRGDIEIERVVRADLSDAGA